MTIGAISGMNLGQEGCKLTKGTPAKFQKMTKKPHLYGPVS